MAPGTFAATLRWTAVTLQLAPFDSTVSSARVWMWVGVSPTAPRR